MANVIALFAIGLVPFGMAFVLQRVFYALEDTRTPFFIQLVQSTVFAIGALIVGAGPVSQIANGIAISMSAATIVQASLLGILLHRRLGQFGGIALLSNIGKHLCAVLPAVGIGFVVRDALQPFDTTLGLAIVCAATIGLAMGAVYVVVLTLVKDPSVRDLLAPFRRRGNKRP
jgi:putative peptidoglycan lipid II flippase